MSSFFQTVPARDTDAAPATALVLNWWMVALGALAAVLVVGGVITVAVGFSTIGRYEDTVLGQIAEFDEAVAVAIVGGAAIVLGIVVGACWLVLGAIGRSRRN